MNNPTNHPNLTPKPKSVNKDLWKSIILEHLHNCFIGISNLTCSEENCPLVLNWDNLEERLSKKGKCCFLKITKEKFLVVNLLTYELNGLEEVVNATLQYRDGSQVLVRTKEQREALTKNLTKEQAEKLSFIDPLEVVYFFNNSSHSPNLLGAEEFYLENLWETKQKIKWDQEKSQKKVFLFCENDPSEETQAKKIDASEKDYLFYISDPSLTNSIKDYEVYSPSQGKEERKQLWTDYKEELSELKEFFGIRHNTQEKEDRQNNPEISLLQSPFLSLERRKKRIREESIREIEQKGFCLGKHTLSYGSYQEHEQELELEEQVEEQEEEQKAQENQQKKNHFNKSSWQEIIKYKSKKKKLFITLINM